MRRGAELSRLRPSSVLAAPARPSATLARPSRSVGVEPQRDEELSSFLVCCLVVERADGVHLHALRYLRQLLEVYVEPLHMQSEAQGHCIVADRDDVPPAGRMREPHGSAVAVLVVQHVERTVG